MVQTRGSDEFEQQIIDDIRRFGWHLAAIADDAEGPAFAYSIGVFHTLKRPEIIIIGMNGIEGMANIINHIGNECRHGASFVDGDETDTILDGYNCVFREVPKDAYADYLGLAQWYYGSDSFPVLQCIWPDKQGRYPWHSDCAPYVRWRQPVLIQKVDWPFCEEKDLAVITTAPVIDGTRPILMVQHDEDGSWQFLCGTTNRTEDAKVVSFAHIVERCPALKELSFLPLGWRAVRRSPTQAWERSEIP